MNKFLKLLKLIRILMVFLLLISCGAADKALGINNDLLPEEEDDDDDDGGGRGAGYYSNISQAMANGVIAYWRMDEPGGVTVYDATTNNYNGTLNSLNNVSGKFDNGYRFNGVAPNSYINVSTLASTVGTYTFSFWVNIQNTVDTQYFFESQTPILRMYILGSATVPRLQMTYGGTTRIFIDPTYIKNSWAHIVYVMAGGSVDMVYLYVNGIDMFPGGLVYADTNIAGTKMIGSNYQGTASNYDGYFDDFAIWNRALTASEILAIYNTGVDGGPLVVK